MQTLLGKLIWGSPNAFILYVDVDVNLFYGITLKLNNCFFTRINLTNAKQDWVLRQKLCKFRPSAIGPVLRCLLKLVTLKSSSFGLSCSFLAFIKTQAAIETLLDCVRTHVNLSFFHYDQVWISVCGLGHWYKQLQLKIKYLRERMQRQRVTME